MLKDKNIDIVWIGGTDQEEEGDWKWTDCNPWNFTKWGRGEPNNQKNEDGAGENCAALPNNKTTGYKDWVDTPCNYKERHFVCTRTVCADAGVEFVGLTHIPLLLYN